MRNGDSSIQSMNTALETLGHSCPGVSHDAFCEISFLEKMEASAACE